MTLPHVPTPQQVRNCNVSIKAVVDTHSYQLFSERLRIGNYSRHLSMDVGRALHQIGKTSVMFGNDTVMTLVDFRGENPYAFKAGDLDDKHKFRALIHMLHQRRGIFVETAFTETSNPFSHIANLGFDLCIDMDDVTANFSLGFAMEFDCSHMRLTKDQMWDRIDSTPGFYANLPLTYEAGKLLSIASRYSHTMLSSTRNERIAAEKQEWLDKHGSFDYTPIYPDANGVFDKTTRVSPATVLIDDYDKNIEDWIAKGGLAINHKTTTGTLTALMYLVSGRSSWKPQLEEA